MSFETIGGVTDGVARLMAMRATAAKAPDTGSVRWPSAWGLQHLVMGSETVSLPHRQARVLRARPADPAWLSCPLCLGSGFQHVEAGARDCPQCSGLRRRIDMVARSGLPAGAATNTQDRYNFNRQGVPSDIGDHLSRVERGDGPGLLLYGGNGLGKTHLAHAITLEVCGSGRPATFVFWPDYLDRVRACFGSDTLSADDVRAPLVGSSGLVVIDDIGAEKPSDFTREEATKVIDALSREGRLVVVTTNLNPAGRPGTPLSMADAIGVRAYSRLSELCAGVRMGGVDFRVAKG